MIEAALVKLLNDDATFAALAGGKLYPLDAPPDELPGYVVYTSSEDGRLMSMTRVLSTTETTLRFDCYGASGGGGYRSAKRVARAVRDCLYGFLRGRITLDDGTVIDVQGIFPDGGEDGLELPAHAEGAGLDYCAVQVQVVWQEV